jgi:hypothetical protein
LRLSMKSGHGFPADPDKVLACRIQGGV